jgi:hypothetical protein
MDFLDHMIDACSAAQVGFHFEEGGCIGMAIAMHEALEADGLQPSFRLMKYSDHVFVCAGDLLCDHQGALHKYPECEHIDKEGLMKLGNIWNSDVEDDTICAREVIALARELAQTSRPSL